MSYSGKAVVAMQVRLGHGRVATAAQFSTVQKAGWGPAVVGMLNIENTGHKSKIYFNAAKHSASPDVIGAIESQ